MPALRNNCRLDSVGSILFPRGDHGAFAAYWASDNRIESFLGYNEWRIGFRRAAHYRSRLACAQTKNIPSGPEAAHGWLPSPSEVSCWTGKENGPMSKAATKPAMISRMPHNSVQDIRGRNESNVSGGLWDVNETDDGVVIRLEFVKEKLKPA